MSVASAATRARGRTLPPPPHPLVAPLLGLAGTWVGDGVGRLPGREGFVWHERFEVGHGGTPALWFRQRTRRPDGSPFHAEDGWVRVPPELQTGSDGPGSRVELAVASPTGVLEALGGRVTIAAGTIVLDATSTTVVGTTVAATVHGTRRRWALEGDRLTLDFWMATPAHPARFHHLHASLHRVPGDATDEPHLRGQSDQPGQSGQSEQSEQPLDHPRPTEDRQ